MASFAITGTIGSGKSMATAALGAIFRERATMVTTFSADACNKRLLMENQEAINAIAERFGSSALDAQGHPEAKKLTSLILNNPHARTDLEAILHPKIRREWMPLAEKFRGEKNSVLLAEIPLLFEKGLSTYFDRSILIACSPQIRNRRLRDSRGIDPSIVDQWIRTQLPQESKIAQADHVVWNDGSEFSLLRQLSSLTDLLLTA